MTPEQLAALLDLHRERLRRLVVMRLHGLLLRRLDPDDILQEAFMAAKQRLGHYKPEPPDNEAQRFAWLRLMTLQTLAEVSRRHLGVQGRDPHAERHFEAATDGSAVGMEHVFAATSTSPSGKAAKEEEMQALQAAMQRLPAADREIIALRHFEQLGNLETAAVLGLSPTAASQRYVRAIARLRTAMGA